MVQPKGLGVWADTVRAPLGLNPEGHGLFNVFYAGYQKAPGSKEMGFGAIGFVAVKLRPQN